MIRSYWLALCLGFGAAFYLLQSVAQPSARAQQTAAAYDVKTNYNKAEHQIPMRDGKRLFTVVYTPKDAAQKYPLLMQRTPYSAGPYGADAFKRELGPSERPRLTAEEV